MSAKSDPAAKHSRPVATGRLFRLIIETVSAPYHSGRPMAAAKRKGRSRCFIGPASTKLAPVYSNRADKHLDNLNFRDARPFLTSSGYERDTLILFESLVSGALDFGIVSKEILPAKFRHDKAEAFVVIEPLHYTCFCFQCKS